MIMGCITAVFEWPITIILGAVDGLDAYTTDMMVAATPVFPVPGGTRKRAMIAPIRSLVRMAASVGRQDASS